MIAACFHQYSGQISEPYVISSSLTNKFSCTSCDSATSTQIDRGRSQRARIIIIFVSSSKWTLLELLVVERVAEPSAVDSGSRLMSAMFVPSSEPPICWALGPKNEAPLDLDWLSGSALPFFVWFQSLAAPRLAPRVQSVIRPLWC